ncbi:DUF742 domain-containing protein [Pseudonocardia oroxyli]|uniref:DUF742 domain-containing protein n=1 Tax=Pseudonocardia oroxyli TaxID=366584 RepID=A0A1G7FMG1_PSEOR|nr:DUF742 domain-containing protein [Pseudonocardia oroxyli]SDE77059.1 Protein of unknown function [Pseudonocardia oroxyli]
MTSGPDDASQRPQEPTFADVMNGFSLDAKRPRRRKRWGRRRDEDEQGRFDQAPPTPPPFPAAPGAPPSGADASFAGSGYGTYETGPIEPIRDEMLVAPAAGAAAVRPYAWTRGRTKANFDLAIETLVSTSPQGREQLGLLQMEHRSVADLCDQPRSVAEIAALLAIPLGVARVLLGDMAGLGVVTVHQTASSTGTEPDLALMERVLSGLRRL